MKTVVVVASGAADRPLEDLGGRTPLEAARCPALAKVAAGGRVGRVHVAPPDVRAEEGAFAVSVFGLDPRQTPDVGGTLDAAAFEVPVGSLDQAFRLSLVTADRDTIYDPVAGNVGRDEATLLLAALTEAVKDPDLVLRPGDGRRNVLVWRGARDVRVKTVPPYEVTGKAIRAALPRGTGIGRLVALIERSLDVLAGHDVNELRRDLGENPATMVWPWAGGVVSSFPTFLARTGLCAGFVGVNPAFVGAARLQEIPVSVVEGATGLPDSNLRAKADATLALLEERDVVFLHVDGLAAASHARDFAGKVEALERFDGYVVEPITAALDALEARLLLVLGEGVSTETGRPLPDPVPFAVYGPDVRGHGRGAFTEVAARDGGFEVTRAHELLDYVLHLPA
jgi:2,3-bisphosphoglycerate-independent phosphoglycerate mutase